MKINVRAIDVIWRKRKEECEEQLKRILGVEELDPTSQEYFRQRLAAAKVVLDGLSALEREEIDAEIAKIKEKGHDKEVQQQYVPDQLLRTVAHIPAGFQPCRETCRAKNFDLCKGTVVGNGYVDAHSGGLCVAEWSIGSNSVSKFCRSRAWL